MACPVQRCSAAFWTRNWFTTNHSPKRHLPKFHNNPNRVVEYWCGICYHQIKMKPSSHVCLSALPPNSSTLSSGSWNCLTCGLCFQTKNGLQNHQRMQNRRDQAPSLSIPGLRGRKKTRKFLDGLQVPPETIL
ncbi:hypothetical protein NPIL_231001 [Nephila pilipes]|uniref:C2H2-type domain-containing protein n=1 Tax=Nephila pilipes TaxID=299642 RepID=A0A8X6R4K4_NEPPI|nr:hypothetical protein NPIL_231001 [Nephila pilipes]